MKRQSIVLMLLLAGAAGTAQSNATLSKIEGGVRVNQGSEFTTAFEQLALQAGDRVMTLDDGKAVIRFDDGCEMEAGPNTLITVPSTSTCAGGLARAQNIAPGGSEAVGASGGADWRNALLIVLPAAAAAAVILDDDDNPTVSP